MHMGRVLRDSNVTNRHSAETTQVALLIEAGYPKLAFVLACIQTRTLSLALSACILALIAWLTPDAFRLLTEIIPASYTATS